VKAGTFNAGENYYAGNFNSMISLSALSNSCHTHASTWVHRYSSLLQWSVPLGQWGLMAVVLCVLCAKCTLHSNHRLTSVIFQRTKWLLPQSGHFLTTYTRIA